MPEDNPVDLGDRLVWYKNSNLHREDGPAVEFKDGRKFWALDGKEATEQEVAAYREAREAEQQRQYHTGLDKPLPVSGPLKLKKPEEPKT